MPDLTPVDYDPFPAPGTANLTPVDYDPFSAEQAGNQSFANVAGKVIGGLASQLWNLPKETLQSSEALRTTGQYDPAPVVNAALMTMGGGAAGVPMEAGEAALGAGPLRRTADLPMDDASRLARAKDMGFRTAMPVYHGSGDEFSAFRAVPTTAEDMRTPGVSVALDPEVANEFASGSGGTSQVYPLLHRADRPATLTLDGSETHGQVVGALRDAFDAGHDAVMIKNYTTPGGQTQKNIVIVRDANQLRSPFAKFDPAQKYSSYLLGAGPTDRSAAAAMEGLAATQPQGIRAYHGSPYDFDKFDLSKIGTGEGAQAYGHGLYFAENPDVAGDYKSKLSTLANVNDSAEANTALTYLARNNYDKAAARADLERSLGTALPDTHRVVEAINSYNPGRMYEVNIAADPEHFLDWDKPLSEQPQNVKDIFAASGVHSSYAGPMGTRIESNAPLGELAKGRLQQGDSLLMQNLRQAGIPGIKYLDQGSRGSGVGTHNYVVFDDSLISILKKYGLAGLIAGGAAHFSTSPVEHDPFAESQ